ncbi:MAG: T9SS type A sorting domain-containing protein, partial [Cryomorphaceae bacterium]
LDQALSPSVGTYYEANGVLSNPLPTNVPYFVLYNRYRGILRIFANIWTDNLQTDAQEVLIALRFDQFAADDNGLSGILRHSMNYDTPLDQPTAGLAHFSPRMQATNSSSFLVADFQMAFDPCICLRETDPYNSDLGKLEFDFETFLTMDIDMVSRSISVQDPITAASFTDDFYNLSEINTTDYVPGHRVYTKMDGLYEDYLEKLQKYQDELDAQDDDYNFLKAFLGKVAPSLTNDFVGSWTTADVVAKLKEDPDLAPLADQEVEELLEEQRKKRALKFKTGDFTTKALKSLAKGILGIGFDYLNLELYPKKSAPVKPTTPVATFTESLYKGTIENTNVSTSSQLYQPGGVTFSEIDSTVGRGHGIVDLDYRNMPAYNKVLGQAALLETPAALIHSRFDTTLTRQDWWEESTYRHCSTNYITAFNYDFKLRFNEDLNIALNNSLDFDLGQTRTYVNVEITLEIEEPDAINGSLKPNFEISENSNLSLTHNFFNQGTRTLQYNSQWVPLELLNQFVFSLEHTNQAYVDTLCEIGLTPVPGSCYCHAQTLQFNLGYYENGSDYNFSLKEIKLKLTHDMYFDQISSIGEQVNTTQIHTYLLYNQEKGINLLNNDADSWSAEPAVGTFDQYLPGILALGNEEITTSDLYVYEVIGNTIYINAQEVLIYAELEVQPGYNVVIQALEQIRIVPGTWGSDLDPNIHMRIEREFYDTQVFEYADNSEVYNFCNNNNAYQANTASKALRMRHDKEVEANEKADHMEVSTESYNKIFLSPNPARDLLSLRSSQLDMTSITIHDLSGRPIKQQSLQANSRETQINLSGIAPGTYIVRVDCGDEVFSEKLVVTR